VTESIAVQTGWLPELFEESKPVEEERKEVQEEPASMEERLYSLLKSNAEQFESKFRDKIDRLQEAELQLDQWQQEKERYRAENEELRERLQARNLEDEKLKIWQDSISGMIQRVEQSIAGPQPQREEEQGEEWEREAMQQGRLAELRLRLQEAEREMAVEEEGEEEGPVVALVRLSQKVKTLVKGMLVETSYA
jgi:chromosome segregation ATPase